MKYESRSAHKKLLTYFVVFTALALTTNAILVLNEEEPQETPITKEQPPCAKNDLTEISWRTHKPCMSAGNSRNWCIRKGKK